MKITMLGSLGHINSFVIPELIKNGHEVTVISHSPNRQKDIEKLGAKSAIGSMMDVDFLTETFSGSDLVYLMYSSTNENGDPVDEARKQAEIFKSAIDRSNVKHVVDLSSVGADQGPEVGGLYIYNVIESILKELSDVTYTFIRPTGFYT
jgi:Predicted nucleoside-diphosphate-sugar epimerases